MNQSEFIEKALKIFPDYDYSEVDYKNNYTKITVTCNCGNKYRPMPKDLLRGHGCKFCGYEKLSKLRSYTTEDFINLAKAIYGDKYDYSDVEYINNSTKVNILCKEYGYFLQTLVAHIHGKLGCPECGKLKKSEKLSSDIDEFIRKAQLIHGDLYDYSNVKYDRTDIPVIIICSVHGKFNQTPYMHLSGEGCPKCSKSKGEKIIKLFLIDNKIDFIEEYEIPCSVNSTGKARLDFYLPKLRTAIEFNGKQHYVPIKHFGGEALFRHLVNRDKNVKKYCLDNGIELIILNNLKTLGDDLGERFKKL